MDNQKFIAKKQRPAKRTLLSYDLEVVSGGAVFDLNFVEEVDLDADLDPFFPL